MWLQVKGYAGMAPPKLISYLLLVSLVLLGILLSILDFQNAREFLIGKWAICGVLAVIAIGLLLLELRYFSKPAHWSVLPLVKAVLVSSLVLVLASIVLTLLGYEELSTEVFLRAPFLPVVAIFLSSITTATMYLCLAKKS